MCVLRACDLIWWSFGAALVGVAIRLVLSEDMRSMVTAPDRRHDRRRHHHSLGPLDDLKLKAGRNWMRLLITVIQVGGFALDSPVLGLL